MHQMSYHVSEMLTAPVASPVGPGLESPGGLESSRDAAIADVNCECSSRMRRRCRSARVSFRGHSPSASLFKQAPAGRHISEPVSQSSARDVRTGSRALRPRSISCAAACSCSQNWPTRSRACLEQRRC